MPAGIGPMDAEAAPARGQVQPAGGITAACSEVEIFHRLAAGRVCYCPARQAIYFADPPNLEVGRLLTAVFMGLGRRPEFQQLHLDLHGVFRGAHRISLRDPDAAAVLVALRLAGMQVIVAQ